MKEWKRTTSVQSQESCGGFELREKDNGKNSGWMYTVNGVHPSMGMNDWYVSTGDEIIWHYIDDYKTEQADMKNDDGSYGSAGNGHYDGLCSDPFQASAQCRRVRKV